MNKNRDIAERNLNEGRYEEVKRKGLSKLIIVVSLVAVLAIVVPLMSGCIGKPAAAPPEAPPAAAPPAEEPVAPAVEVPTYNLRGQVIYAPAQVSDYIRPWLADLEVALGGRVNFEVFSGGELMPDDQAFHATQEGTLDFVSVVAAMVGAPIDTIDWDAAPPFSCQSTAELLTMWHELGYGEIHKAAWEDLGGIHYWGMSPADPMTLVSNRPIEKYADFEGLKISSFAIQAAPYEDAGAIMVTLPTFDFYMAGQTGVVDGLVWSGAKEAYSNAWYEVFPYILYPPINGAGLISWLFNEEVWDSFSPDIQKTLTMAINDLAVRQLTYYYLGELESLDEFTVTTLPPEDWDKLFESAMKDRAETAAKSPANAEIARIVDEFNAEVIEKGFHRPK